MWWKSMLFLLLFLLDEMLHGVVLCKNTDTGVEKMFKSKTKTKSMWLPSIQVQMLFKCSVYKKKYIYFDTDYL